MKVVIDERCLFKFATGIGVSQINHYFIGVTIYSDLLFIQIFLFTGIGCVAMYSDLLVYGIGPVYSDLQW